MIFNFTYAGMKYTSVKEDDIIKPDDYYYQKDNKGHLWVIGKIPSRYFGKGCKNFNTMHTPYKVCRFGKRRIG